VVAGAAGHQAQTARLQAATDGLGIDEDAVGIVDEPRLECLAESHGLASDDVLERTALRTGEHGGVDALGNLGGVGEDDAAARSAKRLVRRGGHDVGAGHRAGMTAGGDESSDMGHVDHERGTVVMCDLGKALEVDGARVGTRARDDENGPVLLDLGLDVIEVYALGRRVKTVGDRMVELAGEVGRRAVREVPAVVESHAHDRVAWVGEGGDGGIVGLCAGVRLHVGIARAKEPLHALACEVLDLVDGPASTVVALARQALGILVGKRGADGLHDGERHEVLRGDEFDGVALASELVADKRHDLGVGFAQMLKGQGCLLYSGRPRRGRHLLAMTGLVLPGIASYSPESSPMPLNEGSSSRMILSTRNAWRPPSNPVSRNVLTMPSLTSRSRKRPERQTAFALLW